MKKFVTAGFIIFVFSVLIIILLASKSKSYLTNTPMPIGDGKEGSSITLSIEEIAKHNSVNDCWMILSNKVYNITQDLQIHPAGAVAILPYCGKDGAKGFTTKDIGAGKNHSQNAYALLNNYYVGDVGQTINAGKTNVPTIAPSSLRKSDDD